MFYPPKFWWMTWRNILRNKLDEIQTFPISSNLFLRIFFHLRTWNSLLLHSMATANLNKSRKVMNSTTAASKYIPRRPRISINWNPPFQTQIYFVKVPLNMNIVKQDYLQKKQFLKILWSEVWKGRFQLMLILGLPGM